MKRVAVPFYIPTGNVGEIQLLLILSSICRYHYFLFFFKHLDDVKQPAGHEASSTGTFNDLWKYHPTMISYRKDLALILSNLKPFIPMITLFSPFGHKLPWNLRQPVAHK